MTPRRFFSYDVVLMLNASSQIRALMPSIERRYAGKRILAATLNHRFFRLDEKNHIKGTIEAHSLDHLMFSMRPSSHRLIAYDSGIDIGRFKDLSEVIFALQVMARYEVPEAILDSHQLAAGTGGELVVGDIEQQLLEFLDEVADRTKADINVEKQFPWLFSIKALLPEIRTRRITLVGLSYPEDSVAPALFYDDAQIGHLDKDLFWIGFDPAYVDVPFDRAYPSTKWTRYAIKSPPGKGIYADRIRYCARCCLPETMEGITFDELGVCVPCRSSEEKMHIDWEVRGARLEGLIDSYRSSNYYDCMLPMSGGKDSAYQAHVLRYVLNVTPLAVTHGQNWASRAGRYNLENCLQKFDLDHLTFNMGRKVINAVARKSLEAIGDACWHCHIGAGVFPVQTALAWNTDLMCYGESTAEADGRGSYHEQKEQSLTYNLEISAKVSAEDMADSTVTATDLSAWNYPRTQDIGNRKILYIHLGDYFFWDEERQVEFVKRNYEWMEAKVENAFKGYKSVECVMAGVHDYANFIKRGIGRSTVQASTDVRRGLITREEGFELAKAHDSQRPHALDFYLEITGLTEDVFEQTLKDARNGSVFASKLSDA